ncbi:MAG TPA: hypothetical protein VLC79_16740 [Cellvibrio sp.]|nr:hypothetical protein [Cellvibrio sp.]
MEIGVKTIVGGIALFVLGGLSVYLATNNSQHANTAAATQETRTDNTSAPTIVDEQATASTTTSATGAKSFYEAAEARREQQLADKAEADRLAKLLAIKERSVECKFWKQQQKNASAAAKIEDKITQYCTLQTSSSASSESALATASNTSTSIN